MIRILITLTCVSNLMKRDSIAVSRSPLSSVAFNVLNTVYFNHECQHNGHVRTHTVSELDIAFFLVRSLRATRSKYNAIVIPEDINTRLRLAVGLRATHSLVYNPSSHADIACYSLADSRRIL